MIEEHTTFHAGESLHAAGMFCDVASALPVNTVMGRYCSIAPGLRMSGFRHPLDAVTSSHVVYRPVRESMRSWLDEVEDRDGGVSPWRGTPIPQPQNEPLIIGNDAWIGDNVVLRGGITIGNGAVIAGHSVITKSIPPYEIWGGNPARLIRKRFPDEICIGLNMIQWWNYDLADLYAMNLSDPAKFIENFMRNTAGIRSADPKSHHVYADLTSLQSSE